MARISMTDFVDFVSSMGSPKATKVKQLKNRPQYHPAIDFYKILREGIANAHIQNRDKSSLVQILALLSDDKKTSNYSELIAGYTKWWGRKEIFWTGTESSLFSFNGVDISVNPELGISLNGQNYLIKLYMKSEPLNTYRVRVLTYLMEIALADSVPPGTRMAVLDVRNSKLFDNTVGDDPTLHAALVGEMGYISSIWDQF